MKIVAAVLRGLPKLRGQNGLVNTRALFFAAALLAASRDRSIDRIVLGKIDPTKPAPRPDPERWIPRSHRAYGKRGKKRNKFVGAQASCGCAWDSLGVPVFWVFCVFWRFEFWRGR